MEYCDFSLHKLEDADITVPLVPETAIGGWSVQMQLSKRFGSTSGHILKSMASGYYGVSGIPHVVVIDQAGKVRMVRVGSGDKNAKDIGDLLEQLLAVK